METPGSCTASYSYSTVADYGNGCQHISTIINQQCDNDYEPLRNITVLDDDDDDDDCQPAACAYHSHQPRRLAFDGNQQLAIGNDHFQQGITVRSPLKIGSPKYS